MTHDPERIPDKSQLLRFVDPRFLEIFDECIKELKEIAPDDWEKIPAQQGAGFLAVVEEAWIAERVLYSDFEPLAEPVGRTKPIGSKSWTYVDHLDLVEAVDAAREGEGSLQEAFEAVQLLEEYRHIAALEPRYYESKRFIARCDRLKALMDPDNALKLAAQMKAVRRQMKRQRKVKESS
jgi:hypothetical protein